MLGLFGLHVILLGLLSPPIFFFDDPDKIMDTNVIFCLIVA